MSSPRAEQLPWVERYRPAHLTDLVSHEAAISTIHKLIGQHCLPHLLFYGPPGTGKTTTAHAIARELYGEKYGPMVLELNASDDRGIDVIREQVKRFASTRVIFGSGHKLIILDESDAMTNPAQAALRRIMETCSNNVRFVMICNYPEKLIPALRSRCTEFRYPPLPHDDAARFLKGIVENEHLEATDDGIDALIALGGGDLRRSVNLMQTTAMATTVINENNVYKCAGYPLPSEVRAVLQSLMNQPMESAAAALDEMRNDRGLALLDVVRELHKQTVLLDLPNMAMANVIDRLSQIEKRVAEGCSEEIQVAAIAAVYHALRRELDTAK